VVHWNAQTNAPIAACLVGADQNGDVAIKTAILNILSLGRIGHIMYYVTAGLETEMHSRYWVRAFSCKTSEHARFVCKHVMTISKSVQPGWVPRHGTQLSLASVGSRGSSVTLNSLASAQSGQSKGTMLSGLSANTAESTSVGFDQAPKLMGPPTSVSQHALHVRPVVQQRAAALPTQSAVRAPRAPFQSLGNAGRGTVWNKATEGKVAQKHSSSSAWESKASLNVENAPAPARVMRQPSLNLDDYLSIVNI
jgi:hypothetical protein